MPFVLDNSVVSGWFLESLATGYTISVARRLRDDSASVPVIWEQEFAAMGTPKLAPACFMMDPIVGASGHLGKTGFVGLLR